MTALRQGVTHSARRGLAAPTRPPLAGAERGQDWSSWDGPDWYVTEESTDDPQGT